ncbi:MAG: peroxiredoxin [Phycisphaerales bacterium]
MKATQRSANKRVPRDERAAAPQPAALTPGSPAPTFTLLDQHGTPRTLKSLLPRAPGGLLLLTFYPEIKTPACSRQVCELNAHQPHLAARGVALAGMSPDDPALIAAFAAANGVAFPLLSAPRDATGVPLVMAAYGAFGEKNLYGRTVTGVRRSSVLIARDGLIAHHWPVVRATGHAERFVRFMQDR